MPKRLELIPREDGKVFYANRWKTIEAVNKHRAVAAARPRQKASRATLYNRRILHRDRRLEWIGIHGPCQRCGTWNYLEVDHIDPRTKEYEIDRIWCLSDERREKELTKCQVLCRQCHALKTWEDIRSGIGQKPKRYGRPKGSTNV